MAIRPTVRGSRLGLAGPRRYWPSTGPPPPSTMTASDNGRSPGADFYGRASSLRDQALELLQHVSDAARHGGDAPDEVIVDLQSVGNILGRVESQLKPVPADEAPAKVEPAKPPRPELVPALTGEAAAVLALAESTVTSALSTQDEAERWLRVIREHGVAGETLRAIGVPLAELTTRAEPASIRKPREPGDDPVERVAQEAADFASNRGAKATGTVDVLFAVLAIYDELFDRALYAAASVGRRELFVALADGARVTA
jgi:hypothetical protein